MSLRRRKYSAGVRSPPDGVGCGRSGGKAVEQWLQVGDPGWQLVPGVKLVSPPCLGALEGHDGAAGAFWRRMNRPNISSRKLARLGHFEPMRAASTPLYGAAGETRAPAVRSPM